MRNSVLKVSIFIVLLLICIFPLMALLSFFTLKNKSDESKINLSNLNINKEDNEIYNNRGASINVDEINYNYEIINNDTPLGVSSGKQVTGLVLKSDFKGHEKQILKGDVVFEIINKNGHSIFFLTFDELSLVVKDTTKYSKYFALDENNTLIRYTYVEQEN